MSRHRPLDLTARTAVPRVPELRAGDSTGELYELLGRRHLILGERHDFDEVSGVNSWRISTAAGPLVLTSDRQDRHFADFGGETYGMHGTPAPKTAGQIFDIIVKAIREARQ